MYASDVFKVMYAHSLDQLTFTLLEIDGYLFVNMDTICDRKYHIAGIDELLYEIGRRGGGRTIVFLFQDGTNIEFSGTRAIIDQTIRQFNLPPEKCIIMYPGMITVPGATVFCNQAIQSWQLIARQRLNDLPLAEPIFNKHFCSMFARYNLYRLKLTRHLHTHYLDKSILAFNNTRPEYEHKFFEEFGEDFRWATENLPILMHEGCATETNLLEGCFGYIEALDGVRDLYQKYFIEIVSETDPHSNLFFSEKTLKNFWLGKPFLLFSGAGSLKTLRDRGYATFSPFINEYYDEELNDVDRLGMVMGEIDRLAAMTIPELQTLHMQLRDVFEYNRSLVKLRTRDWEHTFVDSGKNIK